MVQLSRLRQRHRAVGGHADAEHFGRASAAHHVVAHLGQRDRHAVAEQARGRGVAARDRQRVAADHGRARARAVGAVHRLGRRQEGRREAGARAGRIHASTSRVKVLRGQRDGIVSIGRIGRHSRYVVHNVHAQVGRTRRATDAIDRHRNAVRQGRVVARLGVGLRCIERVAVVDGGSFVAVRAAVAGNGQCAFGGVDAGRWAAGAKALQLCQCEGDAANHDVLDAVAGRYCKAVGIGLAGVAR